MTPQERILSLSIPEPNTVCWLWIGATKGKSQLKQYGHLIIGSRTDGTRKTTSSRRIRSGSDAQGGGEMTTFKPCHCGHGVLIPNGERFECSWTLEKYKAVHGHVPDSFRQAWDAYQASKPKPDQPDAVNCKHGFNLFNCPDCFPALRAP